MKSTNHPNENSSQASLHCQSDQVYRGLDESNLGHYKPPLSSEHQTDACNRIGNEPNHVKSLSWRAVADQDIIAVP